MIAETRRRALLFLTSDLVATFLALAAAWGLRFGLEIVPARNGVPELSSYLSIFPILAVLWPVVYSFYGLYQVHRHRSRIDEAIAVVVATALASLLLIGLGVVFRGFSYSRLALLLFFGADVLAVFAGRTAIRRYYEEAWRHGIGVRHALVVGAGRLGRALVDKLVEHPEAGLAVAGFADDDPAKADVVYRGVPVLGPTSGVAGIVDARKIDTVFLALPLEAHRTMFAVLQEVGRTVADVRVVPDLNGAAQRAANDGEMPSVSI